MRLATLNKYGILAISVLTAAIVKSLILKIIREHIPPDDYLAVFMEIMVTLFIFIPVFSVVGKMIKRFSKAYLNASKKISKNKKKGFMIGFSFLFIIIFFTYAYVKYEMNALEDVQRVVKDNEKTIEKLESLVPAGKQLWEDNNEE